MKINPLQLYRSIQQSGQGGKRATNGANGKPSATQPMDRVTLSDKASLFSSALQHAREAADIREAKISRIQQQIKNGSYSVRSIDIAERMIDNAKPVR
jgi:flagellar biosynthesis anti-sigma factor FlgM